MRLATFDENLLHAGRELAYPYPMIQRILDQPWAFIGLVLVLLLLNVAAVIRVRRDREFKQRRASLDRRTTPRPEGDRRWLSRPRKK